jgi:hypothetical protein
MTVEEVKKNLPRVQVRYNGRLVSCQVSGAREPFAAVYDLADPARKWEFSWLTIARALTVNMPLRA